MKNAMICLAVLIGGAAFAGAEETFESPFASLSFDVPKVKPCKELSADGLKGLWIESEKWRGRPTHVFGYLALPEGASATNRVPGIVLAHGGGGTAYPNWAKTWASKGYAAIVVDTCGYLPFSKPTEGRVMSGVGGPAGWGRFELGLEKPCDQWPYHAVAALVRAHSYLRSLQEVDAEKTGITGISWGGYLTMLATATDRRYKFAMPVYACADFAAIDRECPFFTASRKLAKPEALARWDALFDAKHYAPQMDLPVFWFASSSDAAFPFDLLQRTVRMPKAMPGLAVRVGMKHSHGPIGENMPELFRFADSVVRGAPPLPTVSEPVVCDGVVTVAFDPKGNDIARVELNWCADEVPAVKSPWAVERHPAPADRVFRAKVPASAKWLYANVVLKGETGERFYPEALVSSPAVRPEKCR